MWYETLSSGCIRCATCKAYGVNLADGHCWVCEDDRKEAERKAMPIDKAIVAAVFAHANKHYSKGWDFVVECYTDEELWAAIAKPGVTAESAIADMAETVGLYNERAEDIRNA